MNYLNIDCIEINQLKIPMQIGLHTWEKHTLQNIEFNIKLFLDLSHCDEKLENTICYQGICEELTHHFTQNTFLLLETVALQSIELLLKSPKVQAVEVSVKKSHVIKNCQDVAIVMRRCKSDS